MTHIMKLEMKVSVLWMFLLTVSADSVPRLRFVGTSSSVQNGYIDMHVHYYEGSNYTAADSFIWTLPDLTTLSPGESTDDYVASIRDPDNPEDRSYHYYTLRIVDGRAVTISEFTFTASGPPNEGSTERWSLSRNTTITSDAMTDGEGNEAPSLQRLSYTYDAGGHALVRMRVIGGNPPEEDIVRWTIVEGDIDLEPGKRTGLYESLNKVVEDGGNRIYTLRITPDKSIYRLNFVFHVEKEGHWTTTQTGIFVPPNSWADIDTSAWTSNGINGPIVSFSGASRSTEHQGIDIHIQYSNGIDYVLADDFVWTLPDKSTMVPSDLNDYYAALPGETELQGNMTYHSFILRKFPADIGFSDIYSFTASGPPEDGSSERWSLTLKFTLTSEDTLDERNDALPTIDRQSDTYDADGSALIHILLDGGDPPTEDQVSWNISESGLSLTPGNQNGQFKALESSMGSNGERKYTLRVSPHKIAGPTGLIFHAEASGHWATAAIITFTPPGDWVTSTAHRFNVFLEMTFTAAVLSYVLSIIH